MKIGQGLAWCGLVLGLWGCSGDDAGPAGDSLSCGEGTIRVGDECWPEDRVFGDDAGGSAGGDGSESSSGSNTTMMSGATDAGGTSDGGASTDSGGIGGNGSGGSGATTTDGASTDTSTASGGTSGTGGSVAATTTAGGTGGMSGSSGAGGVTSSTTGVTCSGIACQVAEDACPATSPTSLSGVVYAPSGSLPLYNVVVYVPNAPLEPLSQGLSCETCDAPLSGSPITTAITGADGSFTLEGVPSGENIPLVMQIGKWRREVSIPSVTACADTAVNAALTRLPRNKLEGDIPRIAVSTGASEALECLLRRIGIDDSEFTTSAGDGRVHLYAGGAPNGPGQGSISFEAGTAFPPSTDLWGTSASLENYDVVMLSCEGQGSSTLEFKEPYFANMLGYLGGGGRVLFSHMHFFWLREYAPLSGTADYIGVGSDFPPDGVTAFVDTSFPKGAALSDWLVSTAASSTAGELLIRGGQHSVAGVVAPTQSWISIPMNPDENNLESIQYMTFNTPLGASETEQCGRAVYTDMHVNIAYPDGSGGDNSDPDNPFPTGCANTALSPSGKAMAFMFFDLSACGQPDSAAPSAPPPSAL